MKSPVKSVYRLREGAYYSLASLAERLSVSHDSAKAFVDYMRSQEICKTDGEKGEFSFPYVGIVEFETPDGPRRERRMVFLEPKFMRRKGERVPSVSEGFGEDQKIVLKSILKYCKNQRASQFSSGRLTAVEGCSTSLSRQLALILDVMENGVYQVPKIEFRVNGVGDIAWEETYAQTDPVFLQEGPAYVECITLETDYEDDGYISRLQSCIATQCIGYFEELGLAEPLGLYVENPYEGDLSEFGDRSCIENQIRNELRSQFIDTKQQSLKLMLAVLELEDEAIGADCFDFQAFGMSGFHALWERAIKEVLRDELEKTPASLGLDVAEKANIPLKDYIDSPVWIKAGTETGAVPVEDESDSLEPDFVATQVDLDGNKNLIILDAKYYLPEFANGRVKNQPGVGDVDKQLLYQLAYSPLSKAIRNAFVFPGYGDELPVDRMDALPSRLFATIKVPVFALGKGLPDSFEAYMVDGLSLLEKYVYCVSDDEQRAMLKGLLKS